MTLLRNIYKDFINKYYTQLRSSILGEHEIVLIDMDKYQLHHEYENAVYKIKCKNLPHYVKERLRKYNSQKVVFKHNSVCLIALI